MIIYGHRRYGTVSTSSGDFATFFFHVFFLPLFPTTGVHLRSERELPAPLHRLSVAVAYARMWGLLASAGLLVATSDALKQSLASGAAWLIPTLAVTLATAAAWFIVGARGRSKGRWALGLGLPALALLLATVPALNEYRRRSVYEFWSQVDALPPDVREKLKGRSEAEVRAFLLMTKHEQRDAPVNPWEPTYTRCQLYHDAAACLALGKAAFEADSSISTWALREACDRGLSEGCLHLGLLSEGPKPDTEYARWAFEKACALGSADGCSHQGLGLAPKNPAAAVKLFDQACTLGSAPGCRQLGESLKRGKGVKKNAARATTAFKKACALGDQTACSG